MTIVLCFFGILTDTMDSKLHFFVEVCTRKKFLFPLVAYINTVLWAQINVILTYMIVKSIIKHVRAVRAPY